MVVAIDVIEGKTVVPKSLKLGSDFPFYLLPHPRPEEKIDPGSKEMGGKLPSGVHQVRNGLGRRNWRSANQDQMQTNPERWEPAGSIYSLPGCLGSHHQTRCAQNSALMGFFDGFIYCQGKTKVIGGYNEFFH